MYFIQSDTGYEYIVFSCIVEIHLGTYLVTQHMFSRCFYSSFCLVFRSFIQHHYGRLVLRMNVQALFAVEI